MGQNVAYEVTVIAISRVPSCQAVAHVLLLVRSVVGSAVERLWAVSALVASVEIDRPGIALWQKGGSCQEQAGDQKQHLVLQLHRDSES